MTRRRPRLLRTDARWSAASLVLVALITAANLALGSTDFSGVLMIGPLVASTAVGPKRTAVVAVVAAVAAAGTMVAAHDEWQGAALVRLVGVVAGGAVAVAAARWRVQREGELTAMRRVAEAAQRAILAPVPEVLGTVCIATRYRSAAAEAVVGGDFYDAVETPSGVRVIVGDVRGKGLDAVRIAARVLGAFRLAALRDVGLDEVAADLHLSVSTGLGAEDFVTALVMQFAPDGAIEAVDLGHPPPIVVSDRPSTLALQATAPLGIGGDVVVEHVELHGRNGLLLHTDGLLEARDRRGRFFDVEAAVAATAAEDGDAFLDALLARLDEHTDGDLDDDLALLLVCPSGTWGAPGA